MTDLVKYRYYISCNHLQTETELSNLIWETNFISLEFVFCNIQQGIAAQSIYPLKDPWPEKVNVNYVSTMDSAKSNRVGETTDRVRESEKDSKLQRSF